MRMERTDRGTIEEVERFRYKLHAYTVCPINQSQMKILSYKRWLKAAKEGQPSWEQLIEDIELRLRGFQGQLARQAAAKKPSPWTKVKHFVRACLGLT